MSYDVLYTKEFAVFGICRMGERWDTARKGTAASGHEPQIGKFHNQSVRRLKPSV
ncbi:hypothetical protein [uncultured Campylobacter sp.]|uniref:hypothetical protein n=1 Tax=uncultured Campylobacter sp. TaxID=218934 RepID=UPI00261EC24F|nr:hypothetical protein [uncultured Campylobacter sp.]